MKLPALIVLARARSRMAKPDAALLLQQALSNALAIDEFQYIIPVRFAIIEHAWLIDDFHQAETHISELRILASSVLNPWQVGELLTWIARMNLPEFEFENVINAQNCVAEPYQLELAGNAKLACERWQALGMPFNAAVALLQSTGNAQQSDYLNAYSLLESLQAKAVMLWIRQRAKQQGFYEKLPKTRRGPYAESRQHPAGLTSKEQQIMTLLITGASNHDIANTLSRSQRTIENHVSSILSKLNVDSRIEAMLRVQNEPWLVEQ
jgi:DNA-binding CsgD family transcriptional regulator